MAMATTCVLQLGSTKDDMVGLGEVSINSLTWRTREQSTIGSSHIWAPQTGVGSIVMVARGGTSAIVKGCRWPRGGGGQACFKTYKLDHLSNHGAFTVWSLRALEHKFELQWNEICELQIDFKTNLLGECVGLLKAVIAPRTYRVQIRCNPQ